MSKRPLISFVLTSYKQERFTREAVAGAFAQTYSPLEIILSDDCSRDGTFAVMEEMARNYRGPHRVTLNRNPKNLGLIAHLNKVVAMSRGEFIVPAAGDDISLPQRAETVWRAWQESGGRAKSIYSNVIELQQDKERIYDFTPRPEQNTLKQQLLTGMNNVLGASQCYHRSLFDFFGPLPAFVAEEDHVLPFRAALLGEVLYLPEPLVKYRVHPGNVSQSGDRRVNYAAERAALAKLLSRHKLPWLQAFLDDLATAHRKGLLTDAQFAAHHAAVEARMAADRAALVWLTGNLTQRIGAARKMCRLKGTELAMGSSNAYLLGVAAWPGLGDIWHRLRALRRRNDMSHLMHPKSSATVDALAPSRFQHLSCRAMTVDELLQPILNTTAPLKLSDGPDTLPEWDSVAQVTITTAIEGVVGSELSTAEVLGLKTVGDVVRVCRAHGLELEVASRG